MIPGFIHEIEVLNFPHLMAMAGYIQIGDETGILEGQTRPQRQGDFEHNFNTYHEKYLDMEGIWTP